MKVMIATDGSDASVRATRILASMIVGLPRAEVRLITVVSYELYPGSLVPGEHLPGEPEMQAELRTAVEGAVGQPRRILEEAGCSVHVKRRFGHAPDEILSEVREWNPDLLVLGRRGVRGLERWLGSVSEHVVRHADVPVLVVP